jgi:hypothetical protein
MAAPAGDGAAGILDVTGEQRGRPATAGRPRGGGPWLGIPYISTHCARAPMKSVNASSRETSRSTARKTRTRGPDGGRPAVGPYDGKPAEERSAARARYEGRAYRRERRPPLPTPVSPIASRPRVATQISGLSGPDPAVMGIKQPSVADIAGRASVRPRGSATPRLCGNASQSSPGRSERGGGRYAD